MSHGVATEEEHFLPCSASLLLSIEISLKVPFKKFGCMHADGAVGILSPLDRGVSGSCVPR
eukprot:1982692-Amphidinium_carterae.1